MACFLTPAVVSAITISLRKKIAPKYHLAWLNLMLLGGTAVLAVEHVASGEVVFYPPFLTAMQNPADIPVMLAEMAIVGGAMAIAIVSAWMLMVLFANKAVKVNYQKAASQYPFNFLNLMLWGAAVMILVDWILA